MFRTVEGWSDRCRATYLTPVSIYRDAILFEGILIEKMVDTISLYRFKMVVGTTYWAHVSTTYCKVHTLTYCSSLIAPCIWALRKASILNLIADPYTLRRFKEKLAFLIRLIFFHRKPILSTSHSPPKEKPYSGFGPSYRRFHVHLKLAVDWVHKA